jgi:pyruvate-formate lyase-activating enzyme
LDLKNELENQNQVGGILFTGGEYLIFIPTVCDLGIDENTKSIPNFNTFTNNILKQTKCAYSLKVGDNKFYPIVDTLEALNRAQANLRSGNDKEKFESKVGNEPGVDYCNVITYFEKLEKDKINIKINTLASMVNNNSKIKIVLHVNVPMMFRQTEILSFNKV